MNLLEAALFGDLEAGRFRFGIHAADQGAGLCQSEAGLFAGQNGGDAGAVALAVEPDVLFAPRRDEALALIEAQRPERYAEFTRQLANGELAVVGNRNRPVGMGGRIG